MRTTCTLLLRLAAHAVVSLAFVACGYWLAERVVVRHCDEHGVWTTRLSTPAARAAIACQRAALL